MMRERAGLARPAIGQLIPPAGRGAGMELVSRR